MNDKKNIERLFQEKFKDFEAIPPANAWQNIASKLEKKESKKRVIPFWFKATGIAAGLIIGYFVLNNFNDNSWDNKPLDNQTVVKSMNESEIEKVNDNGNNLNKIQKKSDNTIVNLEDNASIKKEDNQKDKNFIQNSETLKTEEIIVENNTYNKNTNANKLNSNQSEKTTGKLVVNNTTKAKLQSNDDRLSKNDDKLSNKNQIASQNKVNNFIKSTDLKSNMFKTNEDEVIKDFNDNNNISLNKNSTKSNLTESSKSILNKYSKENSLENKDLVAEAKAKKIANTNNQESVFYSNEIKNKTLITSKAEKENNVLEENKLKSLTSQNTNILIEKPKDSVTNIVVAENALEKLLLEKESKEIDKVKPEKQNQWKVRPNIAPIFMNATSGSPIDQRFADNSKTYENNISVGVGIDYALSEKFAFRTGINQFDLSYNTNDVAFYANLNVYGGSSNGASKGMSTINISQTASLMTIIDNNKNSGSADNEIGQNKKTGALNQRIGYLEFPLEISYKFVDKKFGIQMFTGISTLILNENSISLVSNDSKTDVGEANNLNPIHFSTNLGVAFKYSFWKSFEVNFEPTFKYQMFTFNTNDGGFKPYFIGLYSGVSFKF